MAENGSNGWNNRFEFHISRPEDEQEWEFGQE